MGDDKLALLDVDTENDFIVKACYDCIGPFVQECGIGGLRINTCRAYSRRLLATIRRDWRNFLYQRNL